MEYERMEKLNNRKVNDINDFNLYKANNLFRNKDLILTQNISNSKGFITAQIKSILNDINDYRKSKEVDISRELNLATRFGVILKNMVSTPKSNWKKDIKTINKEISLNKSIINNLNTKDYISWNCNDSDFLAIMIRSNILVPLDIEISDNPLVYLNLFNKNDKFVYIEVYFSVNDKRYKIILPNISTDNMDYSAKIIDNYDMNVDNTNHLRVNDINLEDVIEKSTYYTFYESEEKTKENKKLKELEKLKELKKKKKKKKIVKKVEVKEDVKKEMKKEVKIKKMKDTKLDSFIKKKKIVIDITNDIPNDVSNDVSNNVQSDIVKLDDTFNMFEVKGYLYSYNTNEIKPKFCYLKIQDNKITFYVCYNYKKINYFIRINPNDLKIYSN